MDRRTDRHGKQCERAKIDEINRVNIDSKITSKACDEVQESQLLEIANLSESDFRELLLNCATTEIRIHPDYSLRCKLV